MITKMIIKKIVWSKMNSINLVQTCRSLTMKWCGWHNFRYTTDDDDLMIRKLYTHMMVWWKRLNVYSYSVKNDKWPHYFFKNMCFLLYNTWKKDDWEMYEKEQNLILILVKSSLIQKFSNICMQNWIVRAFNPLSESLHAS